MRLQRKSSRQASYSRQGNRVRQPDLFCACCLLLSTDYNKKFTKSRWTKKASQDIYAPPPNVERYKTRDFISIFHVFFTFFRAIPRTSKEMAGWSILRDEQHKQRRVSMKRTPVPPVIQYSSTTSQSGIAPLPGTCEDERALHCIIR